MRNACNIILRQFAVIALFMLSQAFAFADSNHHPFVLIIDAGHGGRDVGAQGSLINEKNVNLFVAQKLKRMLGEHCSPETLKVVMTRDDDTFVTLAARSEIANNAGADLFVSIHANSLDRRNPKRKTISGSSVYTLGLSRSDENFEVAKRENAVMMLEDDYTTTYQGFDPESDESYIIFEMDRNAHMDQSIFAAGSIQNELITSARRSDRGVRQAPFAVLRNAAMPAVLVELDFISNPAQERYMASDDGQESLARAICNGIIAYHNKYNSGSKISAATQSPAKVSETVPQTPIVMQIAEQPVNTTTDSVVYRIQFYISSTPLSHNSPSFKGLGDVDHYTHSGLYKYVTGRYATRKEADSALPQIRKLFKDAFVVRMRGNRRDD